MKNKILILLLCLIVIGLWVFIMKKNNPIQSIEVQWTANNLVTTGSGDTPWVTPAESTNNSVNSF